MKDLSIEMGTKKDSKFNLYPPNSKLQNANFPP
jgi:hypothetical protein